MTGFEEGFICIPVFDPDITIKVKLFADQIIAQIEHFIDLPAHKFSCVFTNVRFCSDYGIRQLDEM